MGMMGWRESQRDGVERRETETVTDRDRDGGERDTEMGKERDAEMGLVPGRKSSTTHRHFIT